MKNKALPLAIASLSAAMLTLLPTGANAQRFGLPHVFGMGRSGSLSWYGDVDQRTEITLQGGRVQYVNFAGKGVTHQHYRLSGRLPRTRVPLTLAVRDGRGVIRIVQRPRPRNGFTAGVMIDDPQPGRGFYHFVVTW